ncbi:MAG: ATP-binding protein [Cyclobacteriaceae bacterium]|jgi:NadR type nicotinamide-nucleotide adenylyltransferase|nr:ATPase [Cytophagales bacterium]HNP78336.1 ATP-binding protein [Cyclobacteriaceae bacterium]
MQATDHITLQPLKVVILGPECTGKTDLSNFLANHYNTSWVPEYARAFLNKLNRPYELSDLIKIAHGQIRLEEEWIQNANQLLVCDTNLMVIKVWSEEKFGHCPEEIINVMNSRHYDLQLLTNVDIPWENDPQREHPTRRDYFWKRYREETARTGVPTVEISGPREQRQQTAVQAIDKILQRKVSS